MEECVKPKDKVVFGDYNSEILVLDKKKVEVLCESLGINYVEDQQGVHLVRVKDVRGL